MSNHFLKNGHKKIHLIEGPELPGAPILHVPGMFGRAEDCIAEMLALAHRKSFALSLRGRGNSDPAQSYTLEDHVSDLVTALEYIGEPAHLCGHSAGNLFCVGAAFVRPDLIRSVSLVDFGMKITLGRDWVERCLNVAPQEISKETITKIARDLPTDAWDLLDQLQAPVCLFRGMNEESHVSDYDVDQFRSRLPFFELIELPNSDHWPSEGDDYNLFIDTLDSFTSFESK